MIYEQWLSTFTDWRPQTTCWNDFSIADTISMDEIRDVFKRRFKEMKSDYKLLTELVMILNHKAIQHSEIPRHRRISELYSNLFASAYDHALSHLSGEELSYFLETTD